MFVCRKCITFAPRKSMCMQRYCLILLFVLPFLAGCGDYNSVMKTADYEYKYEAAKGYYSEGEKMTSHTGKN